MAPPKLLDTSHAVYALSTDGETHRYVGFTAQKLRQRMAMHRWEARHGNPAPLYVWMREVGAVNVVITALEKLPLDSERADLGAAETRWIARLRELDYDLLNQSNGGLGMSGWQPNAQQRAALAERGRKQDLSHLHNPEMKARATAARTGKKRGPYNWTPEGAARSAEGRILAHHNRYHGVGRITKPDCTHCAGGI